MYALNIDKETKRILSACVVFENGDYTDMPVVDSFPEGNIADYLYINNKYVYSPLPVEEAPETVTDTDRLEALEMAFMELASEVFK